MAEKPCPEDITVRDLSGKWSMDKRLTVNMDVCMEVQNVSWFFRKAASFSDVFIEIHQSDSDIKTISWGSGVKITTSEEKKLDWSPYQNKSNVLGDVEGKCRILTFEGETGIQKFELNGGSEETEEDIEWLNSGWLAHDGKIDLIQDQAWSPKQGWRCHMIWGFQDIDGGKKYVRKLVTWRRDKKTRATLVYQWLEPL